MSPNQVLRVALILDGFLQPAWVRELIESIRAAPFAELALVVKVAGPRHARRPWLWSSYLWLDRHVFRYSRDPFSRSDVTALLRDVPRIAVTSGSDGDAGPDERARDAMHEQRVDVAVDVSERRAGRALAKLARHGLWTLQHGSATRDEALAGCREVLENEAVTISTIAANAPAQEGNRVIHCAVARTYPLSVHRNRCNLYLKTAGLVMRKLRELHRFGPPALEPSADEGASGAVASAALGNRDAATTIGRVIARIGRKAVRKLLYREEWTFGWARQSTARLPARFDHVELVLPRRGEWWTDPFPASWNGREFLFVEHLPYGARRAHISVMELRGASWTAPRPVLERPYHLSYPFVFRADDRWYLIPETAQRGTVELYSAVRFPDEWELAGELLSGIEATDSTLHQAQGRWWLFANTKAGGSGSSDDLSIFHSGSLLGPWEPHPRNPVKSDARSSRPAGRLFTVDGALYRPAQVCVPEYGTGIAINRVVRLTTDDYVEEVERIIAPGWHRGVERTHTINHAGDVMVIDAFRWSPRFWRGGRQPEVGHAPRARLRNGWRDVWNRGTAR